MTEPLQVGQFGIVDHEVVERGPNAGVFLGRGAAGERPELFVVAEGTTPASEAFAPHVVSAIGTFWAAQDMSLTGALRRAFNEARRIVADWNRRSIAQHRVSIGLTCFARNHEQAVIAQAGPTSAFHLSGNRLSVYLPDAEHAEPLAGGLVDPQLTRIDFKAGDRLLALSTAAIHELDEQLIGGILGLPGPQALQDLYHRVHHLRHVTVLLAEAPAARQPGPSTREERRSEPEEGEYVIGQAPTAEDHGHGFQPSLFIDSPDPITRQEAESARQKLSHIGDRARLRTVEARDTARAMPPLRRAVGEPLALQQLAAVQRERASASLAASHAMPAHQPPRQPQWTVNDGGRPATPASRSSSFSRGLVRPRLAPPPPEAHISDAPLAAELAAGRRNGGARERPAAITAEATPISAQVLVKPRASMGGRWKGSGSLSRRSSSGPQGPSSRIVAAVGLGVLLLLVAFFTLPGMLDNRDEGRAAELISQASQQIQIAQVSNDPAEQRTALNGAKAMLLEAEQVGGTSTETQQLINQVAGAITSLDAITAPERVELIADLSAYGTQAVTPVDVSIGEGVAYLLDTTGSQVIAQPLDGTAPSTVYAEDAATNRGRPVALTFQDAGAGTARLLIADANGALWSAGAGVVEPVLLNVPAGTALTDIATYGGDLYILDTAGSRVLRLATVDGAFPFEPVAVIEGDESLKTAVRMFVDDEVIVSLADGRLVRFAGELTLQLSQAGIDTPLSAASTPWALPDGGLAIADSAGERIVVLARDGSFVRQYRHEEFAGISALGMRDGAGYLFANGKLVRVTW